MTTDTLASDAYIQVKSDFPTATGQDPAFPVLGDVGSDPTGDNSSLRPDAPPAPGPLAKSCLALYGVFGSVSFVQYLTTTISVPLMIAYYNDQDNAPVSAIKGIALPWAFEAIVGLLSDCLGFRGSHRRPYVLAGLAITSVSCLIMAMLSLPEPGYRPRSTRRWRRRYSWEDDDDDVELRHNLDRPSPDKFIAFLVLATIGAVVARAAAGGYLVELAQRETTARRGLIQVGAMTAQLVFRALAVMFWAYGVGAAGHLDILSGNFGFRTTMIILALLTAGALGFVWFALAEEPTTTLTDGNEAPQEPASTHRTCGQKLVMALRGFQVRITVVVVGFFALFTILNGMGYRIARSAGRTPATTYAVSTLEPLIMAATLLVVARVALQWNWRRCTALAVIATVALDALVSLCNVWREDDESGFLVFIDVATAIPRAITMAFTMLVIVEAAGEGYEAFFFGIFSTITTVGGTIASSLSSSLLKGVTSKEEDSEDVAQWGLTNSMIIAYGLNLLALAAVFTLLPMQKAGVQAIKTASSEHRPMIVGAVITGIYLVVGVVWYIFHIARLDKD